MLSTHTRECNLFKATVRFAWGGDEVVCLILVFATSVHHLQVRLLDFILLLFQVDTCPFLYCFHKDALVLPALDRPASGGPFPRPRSPGSLLLAPFRYHPS